MLAFGLLLACCQTVRRDAAGDADGAKIARGSAASPGTGRGGIYDPDQAHLWNRLHRHLFVRVATDGREQGLDALDPFLWSETRHLIEGASHRQAINLLDEFLAAHGERLVTDSIKRAMLQRDLLAVFDWLAHKPPEQQRQAHGLAERLAAVIRRVSLTRAEAAALPDNYRAAVNSKAFAAEFQTDRPDAPFLPIDLLDEEGSWVCVGRNDGEPTASIHAVAFAARSTFLVFLRLPGGRDQTLEYLRNLGAYPRLWVRDPRGLENLVLNAEAPQFPAGTQVALLRRALLVDAEGALFPSPLVEDVQLRFYHAQPAGAASSAAQAHASQFFYEFKLSREKLFANQDGGLRPVLSGDEEFRQFMSHGLDPFEAESQDARLVGTERVLTSCTTCHAAPGVRSWLSLRPAAKLASVKPSEEVNRSLEWHTKQVSWQKLRERLHPEN